MVLPSLWRYDTRWLTPFASTQTAKLTEMQQELRDSKRLFKEAVSEKEAFEHKYNDVVDSMEVTMLDKEMAEERAETLQHEVNTLRERVDEMHVALNVYQDGEGNCVYSLPHPIPSHPPLLSSVGNACSIASASALYLATCIPHWHCHLSRTQNFSICHMQTSHMRNGQTHISGLTLHTSYFSCSSWMTIKNRS